MVNRFHWLMFWLLLLIITFYTLVYVSACENPPSVPVLMYHHVVTPEEKAQHFATLHEVITSEQFAAQMQYLADNGYHTLTMRQFECYMQHECVVPTRSVLITIDDGNISTHRYILPVLQQHGFTATAFIITSRVKPVSPPWTPQPRVFMGQDQLDDLVGTIETHSHSHNQHYDVNGVRVVHLLTYWDLLGDVLTSGMFLDSKVYAYPFGAHNENIRNALVAAGYTMAFSTVKAPAVPGSDMLLIPRLAVKYNTNFPDLLP